jgi:hypothetical protein
MMLKLRCKIHQKQLKGSEIRFWRQIEMIIGTDRLKYKELLYRVKKKGNIPRTIKRIETIWTGHILGGNCLLKHVIREKTEGKGR